MNKPSIVPPPSASGEESQPSQPSSLDVTSPRHAEAALGARALRDANQVGGGTGVATTAEDFVVVEEDGDLENIRTRTCKEGSMEDPGLKEIMIHGPGLPSPFVASLGGAPETPWYRTLLRFIGPGSMIAVGYMDPGNWATDLSGGSQFYYNPLFAILFASTVAMLLQSLAVKAGLVTGKDLAELCRHSFNPWANFFLYLTAEAAIIATDLAEVIGAAIALNLLFKCPLPWAVAITGLDVLIILFGFGPKYLRWFEFGIMALVGIIGVCFVALLIKVGPNWGDVFEGYIPHRELFTNGDQLWIFMGIVGATIMPHNLFLHTHLIQYRYSQTAPATLLPTGTIVPEAFEKADAPLARHHMKLLPKTIKYTTIDCILSLTYALFINSAILIVAGAAFYTTGNTQIATLHDAYDLLGKLLSPAFAVIFGIALLASGQSSTITGTIAGQVVMSGFLGSRFRVKPWVRRLVSRGLALIPALVVVLVKGSNGLDELLVVSQVILSVQLPFSIWPLIWFTSRKAYMTVKFQADSRNEPTTHNYANNYFTIAIATLCGLIITGLNVVMLIAVGKPDLFGASD